MSAGAATLGNLRERPDSDSAKAGKPREGHGLFRENQGFDGMICHG
jgi:hypothetical protein